MLLQNKMHRALRIGDRWLPILPGLVALVVLALGFVYDARAHSLDEVDALLQGDEKYFQPIDKPAPDFRLRAADGTLVRLADLRGKVVVLHFIYNS